MPQGWTCPASISPPSQPVLVFARLTSTPPKKLAAEFTSALSADGPYRVIVVRDQARSWRTWADGLTHARDGRA